MVSGYSSVEKQKGAHIFLNFAGNVKNFHNVFTEVCVGNFIMEVNFSYSFESIFQINGTLQKKCLWNVSLHIYNVQVFFLCMAHTD